MTKTKMISLLAALVAIGLSGLASASGGDSGTGAVGEMTLSGNQFMMLVGALVGLGLVIWLLAKFLNK